MPGALGDALDERPPAGGSPLPRGPRTRPGPTGTQEEHDEIVATTPDALREQAVRRLRKRADLKAHAAVYVLVNLVVWCVWIVIGIGSHSWWPRPVFLTLFWGIGLVMNAWDVYFRKPISEQDVQREIERLEGGR
ncbi:MAG: 2TM domain-containing protein [Solirubrobacteraceae bacterium]